MRTLIQAHLWWLSDLKTFFAHIQELGVREDYYVYECYDTSSPPFYCSLLIFAYLTVLQLVGIILAFQTRKVKIPLLNDSKYIAALIYISSIILVILEFVTVPLGGYINIRAAIFSGGILLLATIFLALTFVPKVYPVWHIDSYVCTLISQM